MRTGNHYFYKIQARKTHTGKPEGKLRRLKQDCEWFNTAELFLYLAASKDSPLRHTARDVLRATGEMGYWTLEQALAAQGAMETANKAGQYDSKDGYRNLVERCRYEFRIIMVHWHRSEYEVDNLLIRSLRYGYKPDFITKRVLIDGQPYVAAISTGREYRLLAARPAKPKDVQAWLAKRPTASDKQRMACVLDREKPASSDTILCPSCRRPKKREVTCQHCGCKGETARLNCVRGGRRKLGLN